MAYYLGTQLRRPPGLDREHQGSQGTFSRGVEAGGGQVCDGVRGGPAVARVPKLPAQSDGTGRDHLGGAAWLRGCVAAAWQSAHA